MTQRYNVPANCSVTNPTTVGLFQSRRIMKIASYILVLVCCITMSCGNSTEQQVISFPPQTLTLNSGTTEHLYGVFFEDTQKGYAVGSNGMLLTTTNGGNDWQSVSIGSTETFRSYFIYNGVHFVCGGNFIGSGSNTNSITKKKVESGGSFSNFVVSNGQVFCLGGFAGLNSVGGVCLKQTASGESWEKPNYTYYVTHDPWYNGDWYGKAVVTGQNTILAPVSSTDLGRYGITRINTQTLYVDTVLSLSPKPQPSGVIPKSSKLSLVAMAKGGSSTVVAVGQYDGLLLVSKDNGTTWEDHSVADSISFRDVYMTSANVGYACGLHGALLYTEDGGTSWHSMASGTTNDLERIYFPTATIGYAVGSNGTIIKIDLAGN